MPEKIRRRPQAPEYIVRRVDNVPLTFLNDTGEQVQENFSIEFKSRTAYGFVKLGEELESKTFAGETHMECEVLARTITAIIDSQGDALTDDAGEPAALTAAFFLGLLDTDREAIQSAIKADANPPPPSPTPGLSGSTAGGSAG
jgi:hypothetical protein